MRISSRTFGKMGPWALAKDKPVMVDGGSEFQGEFAATVKKFFDVDIMISRHSACSWSA